MPNKTGPGTYKGYQSPETSGWPEPIRKTVRRTYGAWRSKHPGESKAIKTRGSRIAWSSARRRYPALYRAHQKQKISFQKDVRQEQKEHPWAGRSEATRITVDHWKKQHRNIPIKTVPKKKKGSSGSHMKKGSCPHTSHAHKRNVDLSGDRIASVIGGSHR